MNMLRTSFRATTNILILRPCTPLHIFNKCRLMDWWKLSLCFHEKRNRDITYTSIIWRLLGLHFLSMKCRMPGSPMMAQSTLNSCLLNFYFSGMADQMITVYNTSGDTTSVIKYHEGFMGQRVAKVSCLAFHPHLVSKATTCNCNHLGQILTHLIYSQKLSLCPRVHLLVFAQ